MKGYKIVYSIYNIKGDNMVIRLGYVSVSKTLSDITPSHTITYTNFSKSHDYHKIDEVIKLNLASLREILEYNVKNGIEFYRLTSKLIPLATHQEVLFDYIKPYQKQYELLGSIINKHNMRVDVHPDQFTILNSTKKEVLENTYRILDYHYHILKALHIKNPIIILHVGSSVFGKEKAIKRFINNFNKLPKYLQQSIALENDDKVYNVKDVLRICQELDIPFVLDYHHHICNHEELDIKPYLKNIFATWKDRKPKVHYSSPKKMTKKDFKSHHEYINALEFIAFIDILKSVNQDIDIMLEAKGKDEALFRLVRELKYRTNYEFISETKFIV